MTDSLRQIRKEIQVRARFRYFSGLFLRCAKQCGCQLPLSVLHQRDELVCTLHCFEPFETPLQKKLQFPEACNARRSPHQSKAVPKQRLACQSIQCACDVER